jgi:cysteine desulfurase/selenocysteine lyase
MTAAATTASAVAGARARERLDLERVRREFPALERLRGRRQIYLDSAASTQTPRPVIDAVVRYYEEQRANVHRGDYELALAATQAYEAARDTLARFLGVPDRRGLIFTRGATEALNLVAHGWARRHLAPGDEVLLSVAEHHSNLVPWQLTARERGAHLRFLGLTEEGELDLTALDRLVGPRTRLIALTAMSNVLGARVPLAPVLAAARAVGARVLVDAAQLALHEPIDLAGLGADFLVVSGHKLLGPTGVGLLAARVERLEEMDPLLSGGEMVSEVTLEGATWAELPQRLEAGTPPIAAAIGLGAAAEYLQRIGHAAIRAHEEALTRHGLAVLDAAGVRVLGPRHATRRAPVFSFTVPCAEGELHPHDLATLLADDGIAVRAGHQCAKPLLRELGVSAVTRASCAFYTSPTELDALAAAIERARAFFTRPRPRG